MSAVEAAAQATEIREMTRAVLTDGVDYGVIPGTRKPSLFKPGAEWLLKWFGFTHRFDVLGADLDENGAKVGVLYRCNVTRWDPEHGCEIIVATCDGYADRAESKAKWAKAPWNTVVKMAQKRALVGAALQATGTSGLFTQDMEDIVEAPPPIRAEVETLRDRIANLNDAAKAAFRTTWTETLGFVYPPKWAELSDDEIAAADAQLDAIVTNPPQLSKRSDAKKLEKIIAEFFYVARTVLADSGRLVIMFNDEGIIKAASKKHRFKVAEKTEVWQGKERFSIYTCRKA